MSQSEQLLDNLYQFLKPHEEFIKRSQGWLNMAQLMAPALVLLGMKRTNSTNGIPVIPFLFMSILTSLNAFLAQSLNDGAQLKANLTAFACSIVYLTTYFYYVPAKEKPLTTKIILIGAGFIGSFYFYINVQSPAIPPFRIELVIRSVLYSFYLLAFVGVLKAFNDKCTRHMPFEMCIAGTLMTINKLTSNILANNRFFITQFAIFLFIHILQLICFILLPAELPTSSSKPAKKPAGTKEKKEAPEKLKKNKKTKKE